MVKVIKDICIFMIIAQALLFFVPGHSYDKYVRILIGIIMIMRFMEPLFQLFVEDEAKQEIRMRVALLEQQIAGISNAYEEDGWKIKDSETEIYESMEEELKKQLMDSESDYEIVSVRFAESVGQGNGNGKEADIIITVSEKEAQKDGAIHIEPVELLEDLPEKMVEEGLKRSYADRLGVDAGRLEILLE